MADSVNHRHNRFVEGAFYVSIGGMGSLVTSVGDEDGDAVAYTFDKTGRSGSSILKAQSRSGYTELWPVPETRDRDVFAELDQLRTDLNHVRGIAESALQPATKE